MKQTEQRKWGYRVNKWMHGSHYYVNLFPDCLLHEKDSPNWTKMGIFRCQKFNTKKDATAYASSTRRKLAKMNIKLVLHKS